MGIQNVQQSEGSYTVLLHITLYTIICTHTEVLNDIENAQMLYRVTVYCLSPLVKENNLLGEKTGTLPS